MHHPIPSGRDPSELKAHFFTLMSHEFRTSLNTILLSVDLLESEAEQQEGEDRDRYLQQIRVCAEHMRNLLNESLANFHPDDPQ